jgi:hypothetical protein
METIIFLVTWTVVSIVPTPCPDKPKANEYGLGGNSMSSCAVFHFKEERQEMSKEFETEKEADEFIKNMPTGIFGDRCENPKRTKITKEGLE